MVAKEHIGDRVAVLLARIPGEQNSRDLKKEMRIGVERGVFWGPDQARA